MYDFPKDRTAVAIKDTEKINNALIVSHTNTSSGFKKRIDPRLMLKKMAWLERVREIADNRLERLVNPKKIISLELRLFNDFSIYAYVLVA